MLYSIKIDLFGKDFLDGQIQLKRSHDDAKKYIHSVLISLIVGIVRGNKVNLLDENFVHDYFNNSLLLIDELIKAYDERNDEILKQTFTKIEIYPLEIPNTVSELFDNHE